MGLGHVVACLAPEPLQRPQLILAHLCGLPAARVHAGRGLRGRPHQTVAVLHAAHGAILPPDGRGWLVGHGCWACTRQCKSSSPVHGQPHACIQPRGGARGGAAGCRLAPCFCMDGLEPPPERNSETICINIHFNCIGRRICWPALLQILSPEGVPWPRHAQALPQRLCCSYNSIDWPPTASRGQSRALPFGERAGRLG